MFNNGELFHVTSFYGPIYGILNYSVLEKHV